MGWYHYKRALSTAILQIDSTQVAARYEVAEHYRTLFAASTNHEYQERYQELTVIACPRCHHSRHRQRWYPTPPCRWTPCSL